MYLLRYKDEQDEKKLVEEMRWIPWRELYALLCNINRDAKKKPVAFKGTDFIKLSFDDEQQSNAPKPRIPDDAYLQELKRRYNTPTQTDKK